MASSALITPSTIAEDSSSWTLGWTNISNADVSNNSYATSAMSGSGWWTPNTYYIKATNRGAAIPAWSTINWIEVKIEHKGSASGVRATEVKLVKWWTIGGNNKWVDWTNLPTSDTVQTYWSPTDLRGQSRTSSDINSSNFGCAFRYRNNSSSARTVSVDDISIVVYYTRPGEITLLQAKSNNAWWYVNVRTITWDNNTTNGSTILVFISTAPWDANAVITGIEDSQSNTYIKIDADDAEWRRWEVWYAKNITWWTTPTITIHWDDTSYYDVPVSIREIANASVNPLDVYVVEAESSYVQNHVSSATSSTSQAYEMVVVWYAGDANSWASLASWRSNLSNANWDDLYSMVASAEKVVDAIGTQTGEINTTAYLKGVLMVVCLKEAVDETIEDNPLFFGCNF